jgi:tripartite-type tricarboxylate transporter receptor subunit TctC
MARLIAQKMSEDLKQQFYVENRPGAGGNIGMAEAARAAPDGYTIFMGPSGPMTINPATYSKLPYDPQRDFAPISMICEFPLLVTVDARLPIKDMKELVAYAKANPGKSNYASSAGIFQITTELFKQKTGTAIEMIPYKSSGESVQAVIGGQVMMTIVDPPPATGALKAGTLRGLAVTSAKRHPAWPDLPTMAEAGIPDMEVPVWTAFFAPAKTPPAIMTRLQKEVARVVQTAEVRERFAQMGLEPVGGSSDDLARRVARDIQKWTAVAKAANIKND